MAKESLRPTANQSASSANPASTTLSTLRQDIDLWYRILILLHDLSTIGHEPSASKRLSSTTHELYISAPYFTETEAFKIRMALIDNTIEITTTTEEQSETSSVEVPSSSAACEKVTVEEGIHNRLANFFDKRRASGDSRPCGPHDMVPIYVSVFGIGKDELKDEQFLSRLRRCGLGESMQQAAKVRVVSKEKRRAGRAFSYRSFTLLVGIRFPWLAAKRQAVEL